MINKKQINLVNIRKIQHWVKKDENRRLPSTHSENEEERHLAGSLNYIKNTIIKSYIYMSNDEKIKYKEKHPEIEEVIEIMTQINKSINTTRITNMRELHEWLQKTGATNYPNAFSKDAGERSLRNRFYAIKYKFLKPFQELENDEEREEYRLLKYPDFQNIIEIMREIEITIIRNFLQDAREVKDWIKNTGFDKRLAPGSKNEEIKKFARKFLIIKNSVNRIYSNWTREQQEICKKTYSEVKELLDIIEQIDELNVSIYLQNARGMKKWSETFGENKPPQETLKDEDERRWGNKLHSIRDNVLKPYYMLKTEEEKAEYRRKHPDLEEIMKIVEEMDRNNLHPYLVNARNIKEWSNKNKKIPQRTPNNEEESQLATQLKSIRYYFIKPYLILDKEGQEKYRKDNPEIDEVFEIIISLDAQYGTKNKRDLARLIIEDIKKERKFKEARELKEQYEYELKKKDEQQEEKIIGDK